MKNAITDKTESLKKLESLSVVFPAYNEAANVETAVKVGHEVLKKYADDVEVIMVNDGSSDNTGELLDNLAEKYAFLKVVHHPKNLGYGAALRSGFNIAKNKFVFFTDSDLQFDLNEFDVLSRWSNDFDIVVGYRAKRADPIIRTINAWCWNRLIRIVLGVKVRDIDCAFKLFKRDFFDTTTLTSTGAMINTEIFAHAFKKGLKIKEVPVSHFKRNAGEQTGANLGVILRAFKELMVMQKRLSAG